jgi:hypothetical protein
VTVTDPSSQRPPSSAATPDEAFALVAPVVASVTVSTLAVGMLVAATSLRR